MWRFIKWFGLCAVAIVILVGAGGIILINQVDLTAYKKEIAEEVEAITGRKLVIRGKIEKHMLTLTPAIVLNDVTFSNARWSKRPQMLKAKKIRLVVRLLPLITGNIDIKRFDLDGADIVLETNKANVGNWVMGKGGATPAAKKRAQTAGKTGAFGLNPDDVPFIEKMRIKNSRFTYIDGRTGLVSVVGMDDVRFDAPGRDKAGKMVIKGTVNGSPITTQASTGSFNSFLNMARDYPVKLTIRFGSTDMAGDFKVDFSGKRPRVTGALTSARLNVDEVSKIGGNAPAVKRRASRYIFGPEPLPLGLMHAVDARITVQIGQLIVGRNPLKAVAATVSLQDGVLSIPDLRAGVHGTKATANLTVNASSRVPTVALKLKTDGIPLREVTKLLFDRVMIASSLKSDIDVTGAGRSPREIAAGLNGTVLIRLGGGPINSKLLGALSTNILGFLSRTGGGGLAIRYGVIRSKFTKGIGATGAIVDTTRITFCGNGIVNLRTERMNMLVDSKPKGLAVTNVAGLVPIRIAGPLTSPGVKAEAGGIPKQLGKSLLGLATGSGGGGCGGKKATRTGGGTNPGKILRRLNPFGR